MTDVKKVTIQVRAPRGSDLGRVEIGYYCVVDGFVVLTDADGKPLGSDKRQIDPGGDAHLIACRMVRNNRKGRASSDFNRPLVYPKTYY
jgi:hypothetical protein